MTTSLEEIILPFAPPGGDECTVDLLEHLPESRLRYEILDGVLLIRSTPGPRHQRGVA